MYTAQTMGQINYSIADSYDNRVASGDDDVIGVTAQTQQRVHQQ